MPEIAPLPVDTPTIVVKPTPGRKSRPSIANSAALIPLFYAALLYLVGIILAHFVYLRPGFLLAGLAPITAVAWLAIHRAPRLRWLPVAVLWTTLGAWSAETEPAPAPDLAITQISDGLLRTVDGTVTDAGPLRARDQAREPEEETDSADDDLGFEVRKGAQLQRVDLELSAAEVVTDTVDQILPLITSQTPRIRLSVLFPGNRARPVQPIACGQHLRAVLRMLPPETFRDPGVWNRAIYLETQHISAIATLVADQSDNGQSRLELLDTPLSNSLPCLLNRWRDATSGRLRSLPALTHNLPQFLRATPADAAMLTALLTGDRTFLTRSLRGGFERTGSFHLIVVSGLHMAILAGCVFAVARRLRIHRYAATALTLALTLAYALFTGFAIPAQRSFWMIALYLIGRLLYRNRSPLNVLGFATLALAAASPRSIFDASLQMTVLAVAAIAGIAVPLLEPSLSARAKATKDLRQINLDPKLPPRIAQFRVTLRLIAQYLELATTPRIAWQLFPFLIRTAIRLAELIFLTLVVELALALPMALYFHRITLYALPVNLVILPLLGLLVPAAMLLLLLLTVWPAAAILPATVAVTLLHLSLWIVRKLGALTLGNLRVPDPTTLQIGIALLLFVLAIQLARRSGIQAGIQRRLAFAALALSATAALYPRPVEHPKDALLFEAIDVGQGDSLLLISPEGKTLLVDAGGLGFTPRGSSSAHVDPEEFDVGEEVVSATLWSRGIRHLDAVALTHAHHDHMGGMPAILRNFHPSELWVGNNPPVAAYNELLQTARTAGVPIRSLRAGDQLALGQLQIRVLAPAPGYHPGSQPGNNDSLVLQASFRASSILLAGDAEAPEENAILKHDHLQSTLLKIGHHGSFTSTRPAFLAAVQPSWAVLSCGRRNRFGHPRPEILAELQAAHTRTFRTDIDGATCFLLNGQSGPRAVTPQPMCLPGP